MILREPMGFVRQSQELKLRLLFFKAISVFPTLQPHTHQIVQKYSKAGGD